METAYQKEYKEIYLRHWWYRAREWCILRVIKNLHKNKAIKILDVGCGPGLLLPKLEQFGEVEGIEPAESLFEYEEKINPVVHRILFPDKSRNLPSNHYDMILLLDVLEHIKDDNAAMFEVHRILKHEGYAIITVPAFMSLWGPHDLVNHHLRRYTLLEMKRLITIAGLHQVWGSYYFGWCFIPVWVVRHIRRATRKGNPEHDFKIPSPWLNTLLKSISCLDFRIARKLGLPFGSSLIVIAKKN